MWVTRDKYKNSPYILWHLRKPILSSGGTYVDPYAMPEDITWTEKEWAMRFTLELGECIEVGIFRLETVNQLLDKLDNPQKSD